MSNYKIEPLDKQVNKSEPTTIPKPPFSYYIVAPKGGGKTTLLLNMLLKKPFYKGVFNKVYFISPTSKLDAKTDTLRTTSGITSPNLKLFNLVKNDNNILSDPISPKTIPPEVRKGIMTDNCFLEELDLTWLAELVKKQKYIITNYGKQYSDKVLLILDDSIASKTLKSKKFISFLLNSRQYNISTIFVSQSYNLLDKSIRINNSFISLFEIPSIKSLQDIYEENPAGLDWKSWLEVYRECVRDDFGFMSISYQNPKKYRIIHNLEEFLILE